MKIFFTTFLVVAVLPGCGSLTKNLLKDPEINIIDMRVTEINLSDVFVAVKMKFKNPNPIALNVDTITYDLNFSGETVAEGVLNEGLQLPADGESNLILPLKFKLNSIGHILTGFLNNSFSKEYELKGTVKFGIFKLPFVKKGSIDFKK